MRKLSEQLKAAIEDSGLTPYLLASRAGICRGALARFLRGDRGLTLDTADKLGEALGLKLVETGRAVRRRPRGTPGD